MPFQTRSSVQSPNVIQSKKRKLSSPSVECKSSKTIKILKNLSTDNANDELDDTDVNIESKDIAQMEIIEDMETENAKENASNKRKSESKNKMPKRISIGQKKLEQSKLSPLTKFLQKTDKQKDSPKEESQISLQEEKDDIVEEIEDNSKKVIEIDVNRSETTNSLNDTAEDSFSTVNNSLSRSDSDFVILSSDSEDKDEKTKSITSTPKTANSPRMNKAKQKKLTHKREEKKLLIAKKKEENKLLQMVDKNIYNILILFCWFNAEYIFLFVY